MAKRMILMVVVMVAIIAGLGFVKFKQFQAMAEQFAAMQPPPDAVTTIVAAQQEWRAAWTREQSMSGMVRDTSDLPAVTARIAAREAGLVRWLDAWSRWCAARGGN